MSTPVSVLLEEKFETRDLPATQLVHFNGDSKKCPDFIQNLNILYIR